MFTGIVAGLAIVSHIDKKEKLWHLQLHLPAGQDENLQLGASIAVNGACLTIASIQDSRVTFDIMMETLRLTNLRSLNVGDKVNIERAARFGDEIGGHFLSGHIHAQAEIISIKQPEHNRILTLKVPSKWQPYIFSKGFVALDGASLTVNEVEKNTFKIYLIPETCRITTLGFKKVGETLNLEVDSQTQTIVETVERILKSKI